MYAEARKIVYQTKCMSDTEFKTLTSKISVAEYKEILRNSVILDLSFLESQTYENLYELDELFTDLYHIEVLDKDGTLLKISMVNKDDKKVLDDFMIIHLHTCNPRNT